ncbi:MAG: sulfotransferase domain-containing protein [Methylocella sp.]
MEKQKILAYFGHHKCATTLMLKIINEVCDYTGRKHAYYHSPKMWGYKSGFTLNKAADENELDFVSYTDADLNYIGGLDRFRGIHVIRDPRDIAISAYFSHRYSHSNDEWPELAEFRKELERLPKDEGILENFKFTAQLPTDGWNINLFDTMKEWNYQAENVLEVRFEDLIRDPYQNFLAMFGFLGLLEFSEPSASSLLRHCVRKWRPRRIIELQLPASIPAWVLLMIVYQNRFAKLAGGRKNGEEDEKSHYRKGTPGDWRKHFNEQHKQYFKEHYNDLLVKLGYESGYDW